MTDIYQAGDAVEFSVAAIYQVGNESDGYTFYTSAAARISGDACTVPHLTEPTADLWLMLGGVRSDVQRHRSRRHRGRPHVAHHRRQ